MFRKIVSSEFQRPWFVINRDGKIAAWSFKQTSHCHCTSAVKIPLQTVTDSLHMWSVSQLQCFSSYPVYIDLVSHISNWSLLFTHILFMLKTCPTCCEKSSVDAHEGSLLPWQLSDRKMDEQRGRERWMESAGRLVFFFKRGAAKIVQPRCHSNSEDVDQGAFFKHTLTHRVTQWG